MLFPLHDENPTTRTPYVTYGLVLVNLAIMVWLSALSPLDERKEVVEHGFIPARISQLTNPKLVIDVPLVGTEPGIVDQRAVPTRRPVQVLRLEPSRAQVLASVLTSMFLHGGWLHVAGNMWFLFIFGNNIEERLGHVLYLVFYLVGGLLATSCHWVYDPNSTTPVIGASGAVATVLGAYAVTFPHARVRTLLLIGIITVIDIPAMAWLGLWFVGELVTAAFAGKGLTVAVWAHIGGFAAGALLMPILTFGTSREATRSQEIKKHFSFPEGDGQ
jgi:membrane associated rhomboid family serine protease